MEQKHRRHDSVWNMDRFPLTAWFSRPPPRPVHLMQRRPSIAVPSAAGRAPAPRPRSGLSKETVSKHCFLGNGEDDIPESGTRPGNTDTRIFNHFSDLKICGEDRHLKRGVWARGVRGEVRKHRNPRIKAHVAFVKCSESCSHAKPEASQQN